LQRAGGALQDIVWMTVAVSDGRYAQRFTDIRTEIYGSDFPASTLLTAASFAVPEITVEITPIAVVAG
jgi:2-iminobutanoate/2-iminopropanoate deaminase